VAGKPDAEEIQRQPQPGYRYRPRFPWQITALDGYGGELQLVKDHRWGVWSSATLNAAAATFNRVDVRRPSLKLTPTPQRSTLPS
jgi:hypothetical protein